MRLVSVKVTKHGTIPYVRYGFLLVCYSNFVPKSHHFWDFGLDLESRKAALGHSSSSEWTRPMTFYLRSIATMGLSHTVSKIK